MSTELNFDQLRRLFETNPEKFEELRKQEIEKVINSASEKNQNRLRGLQFQIDAKREIHKHAPYVACMEISKMMHESFDELRYHLNQASGNKEYVGYQEQTLANVNGSYDTEGKVLNFQR